MGEVVVLEITGEGCIVNRFLRFSIFLIINLLLIAPCFALDLDATVTDKSRQNYKNQPVVKETLQQSTVQPAKTKPVVTQPVVQKQVQEVKPVTPVVEQVNPEPKPEIKQDLPKVPNLPSNANSSTVAPINTQYSGKMPNENALIPCSNIKVGDLIIDESVLGKKVAKAKTEKKEQKQTRTVLNYRATRLAKGTQIRAINQSRITDALVEGQTVSFLSTQEIYTPYFRIPKNTKFIARVVASHRPQMTCNGGLVGLRIVSANINGYNQQLNGGIIRKNDDSIHFSNLKGKHTYITTVGKKAKWGQNKFKQWSKTSHNLANKGAGVIIAPFPYIGGCVLAAASTVSSPVTALLGKGGNLNVPAGMTFTIKLYEDALLRY